MGMYMSFSKTNNDKDIFYTVRVSKDIYTDLSHQLPNQSFDDYGKLQPMSIADIQYVYDELNKYIRDMKDRIFLTMLQSNYNVEYLKIDIDLYEDCLRDAGTLALLLDIADDNNNMLYVSVG